MDQFLSELGSSILCPAAVLYIYLLNDRWRYRPVWRWLFLAACGPVSILLTDHLTFLPMPIRILGIWVLILPFCWIFSDRRDARLLFVLATGILFSYLCTITSSMLAFTLPVHRALLRIGLNALFLFLGLRFFRPVFLETYRVLKTGWLAFTLMPVSLLGIFLSLLVGANYVDRYDLFYVRMLTHTLALLTVVFYCASFFFFRRLGRWQQRELDSAILTSQVSAYGLQSRRKQRSDDYGRILRHDLRHYLRILSSCIQAGDTHTALQTIAALEQHMENANKLSKEVPRHEQ